MTVRLIKTRCMLLYLLIMMCGMAIGWNRWNETSVYDTGSYNIETRAEILTNSPNHQYDNPLIFVEGFDANHGLPTEFTYVEFENRMDEDAPADPTTGMPSLKEQLIQEGYSIMFIDLGGNHRDLTFQARSFGMLMQKIWDLSNKEPLKIIGFSMGGLVSTEAIYQRNFSNTENWDFRCNLLITYDSPHSGAYVPKGIFGFTDYFKSQSEAAMDMYNALHCWSASQMLILGFYGSVQNIHDYWQEHYNLVLTQVAAIQDLRRIGVVNGSWNGITQYPSTGLRTFKWELTVTYYILFVIPVTINIYDVRLYSQGRSDNRAASCYVILDSEKKYYHPSNAPNLENSPGGWSDFYQALGDSIMTDEIADEIASENPSIAPFMPALVPDVYNPNSTFINTFSAAGLHYETFADYTDFEQLELTKGDMENYSHLDKIYHHNGDNQEHCEITPEFRINLVDEIHQATISPKVEVMTIINNYLLDD